MMMLMTTEEIEATVFGFHLLRFLFLSCISAPNFEKKKWFKMLMRHAFSTRLLLPPTWINYLLGLLLVWADHFESLIFMTRSKLYGNRKKFVAEPKESNYSALGRVESMRLSVDVVCVSVVPPQNCHFFIIVTRVSLNELIKSHFKHFFRV